MKTFNDIQIVDATIEDVLAVSEIEKDLISIAWSYNQISLMVDKPDAIFRVAKINDEVVGYYSFSIILDEGDINNIAVKKQYQNKGIGNMLMSDMLKIAKDKLLTGLTLEVAVNNEVAKTMYLNKGFVIEGIRKKYYNNCLDALIMWLRW